jgi:hypothetical protein
MTSAYGSQILSNHLIPTIQQPKFISRPNILKGHVNEQRKKSTVEEEENKRLSTLTASKESILEELLKFDNMHKQENDLRVHTR